jgi:PAS domain S-box-containing protein
MNDAVIGTDRDGTIRFINEAAATLTGWPAYAAVGLPLSRVFRVQASHSFASSPKSILLARSGQTVAIEGNAQAVRDQDGELWQVRVQFARRFARPAVAEGVRDLLEPDRDAA